MRVDWCVSSWFRIKNTHSLVSLVRVVIICPASTHTASVSSPSLTVLHLPTYIHQYSEFALCTASG